MNVFQKAYHGEIHVDFVGRRRQWFMLSATLVVISILALSIRGTEAAGAFVRLV